MNTCVFCFLLLEHGKHSKSIAPYSSLLSTVVSISIDCVVDFNSKCLETYKDNTKPSLHSPLNARHFIHAL